MSTVFTEHVAQLEQTDRATWLGEMLYFTIPETTVDHGLFAGLLSRLTLDSHTPRMPHDEDVFKRVFGNRQVKEVDTADPEIKHRFLVRSVDATCKELVVEKVDAKGRRLSHDYALQVVFDSAAPSDLTVNPLPNTLEAETVSQVEKLAEEKAAEYRAQRGHVTSYAVREVIRRVLDDCHATIIRSGGGLYFVAAKHADTVANLKLLTGFQPGWEIRTIPCINDPERRDLVRQAYESESIGEVDELIDEVLGLIKASEEITGRRFAALIDRQKAAKAKMADYEELLDDKMSSTETRLTVLGSSMTRLLAKVKS